MIEGNIIVVLENNSNIPNVAQMTWMLIKKGRCDEMVYKEKNYNHEDNKDYTHFLSKKDGRKKVK